MGQLYLLDLSGNALAGPLPAPWARQRWLFRLGLARNALAGPLPREWGRLGALLQLDLGGNALTGGLPPEWGELRQATSLDLSRNRLGGPLPPAWARLASLQMLGLEGNQLSGVSLGLSNGADCSWRPQQQRRQQDGHHCIAAGWRRPAPPPPCPVPLLQAVPAQWAPLASRAYRIALAGNPRLCGTVPPSLAPAVLAAGGSSRGSGLASPCPWQADAEALLAFKAGAAAAAPGALPDWQPEANPCSADAWTGVSCAGGRVAVLNLAHAGLALPSLEPLGRLGALQKLLLAGNRAGNASLPASWASLRQLQVADLSGTGVGGSLPPAWAQMGGLRQLLLGGNNLNGMLPAGWAALEGLQVL